MVMGNLCVHKGERVRQLAENAGFELIYLPPYSPELNSIEAALFAGLQSNRDLPTTMRLQTQTVLSLAPKGCSDYWRW
jgi:hypothetical protein